MRTIFLFLCFIASISTGYAQQDDYFITTWNTEEGDPGNATIMLPISGGYYDVDINYDGNFDADMTNLRIPTIIDFGTGNAGIKTIAIRPSPNHNPNKLLQINHAVTGSTPQKLTSIKKWGDIVWTSMGSAFYACSNMTLADDAGVPDLSMVTNMSFAFARATSFTGNLSSWDVSNVTNMLGTFALATSFNSDLSRWDVSNVTTMQNMFSGAHFFKVDLSRWDVSAVTDMTEIFRGASDFTSNLKDWNVSNVTDMTDMFTGATSFTSEDYDALLLGWSELTVQNRVTFGAPPVIYCAGKAGRDILTSTYNWTISGDTLSCPFITTWNTQEQIGSNGDATITLPITEGAYDVDRNNDGDFDDDDETSQKGTIEISFATAGMHTIAVRPNPTNNTSNQLRIDFGTSEIGCEKLMSIDKWGLIVWTSMKNAFAGCSNMTIADDAGVPDLSMVTDMSNTFSRASSLTGNLKDWDVSKVTNMNGTFQYATSFTSNLSSWNVSKVTSIANMFLHATNFNMGLDLDNINVDDTEVGDIGEWNVSKVTDMNATFYGATNFISRLKQWNVSKVINMENMFADAEIFDSNLSDWDTSEVTNMNRMFVRASNFTSDLSRWNVSNVTSMNATFRDATSFNSNISSWNVSQVMDMTNMFTDATSFSDYNYEKLLAGWPNLSLQSDVTFGAPPTTYCVGKAGRDILTSAPHNWNITGDMILPSCEDLAISIKAFLQGPYNTTTSKMNASLLTANNGANIIPTTSPYGDGATVESTVFDITTGDDAIVDWVEISLHDPIDANIVISSTSALLQRDGDVVALDGSSGLQIDGIAGDYKVSINHRNHIPVIIAAAKSLSTTEPADINFINDFTIVRGGSNAMAEVATEMYALFSGDVNGDNQVQVDDYNAAIQDIGRGGYLTSDVDMNGELQVSDINFVLKTLGKGKLF